MTSSPLVSVVVVTFDRPKLLARAMESIAQQTYPSEFIEVVLVNDAGIDPASVVDEFRDRIHITRVDHERNTGIAGAINSGIKAASGDYVCFLADDDRYYPRHIEVLVERAEELGGRALVYSDALKVVEDENGHDISRLMYQVPAQFNREQLLVQNFIPGHCFIVPRQVFEEAGLFDEDFEALEDWDMWLRATERFPVGRVLEVTAEYRWRANAADNSTTRERPRHYYNLQRLYAKHPAPPRLMAPRAQNLAASQKLLEEHAFDLSVLVLSDGDLQALSATLKSVVGRLGEQGSYEVLIHAPRADETSRFLTALEGDVVLVFGDPAADSAWHTLERKAAGRKLCRLAAGELLAADTAFTDAPWTLPFQPTPACDMA